MRPMPGSEIILLLASWFITNALSFLIVILDERRMTKERLERAWPPSSRDAAIVAFGMLALPVHFAKTRGHFRSLRGVLGFLVGLLLGLATAVVVALASTILIELFAMSLGLPSE